MPRQLKRGGVGGGWSDTYSKSAAHLQWILVYANIYVKNQASFADQLTACLQNPDLQWQGEAPTTGTKGSLMVTGNPEVAWISSKQMLINSPGVSTRKSLWFSNLLIK